MEQVKVRITGQLVTSQYGTLNAGHILATDAAYAKFVVEEMKAGEYIDAPGSRKAEKTTEATTEKKVNKHG